MMKKRIGAASIVYNDTIWVTGGHEKIPLYHDSSEYILSSGQSVAGPNLPMKMAYHAIVNINKTSTIFIGGNQGGDVGWCFGQFHTKMIKQGHH